MVRADLIIPAKNGDGCLYVQVDVIAERISDGEHTRSYQFTIGFAGGTLDSLAALRKMAEFILYRA